ncbi:MAG: hypothetical protein QM642_10405 [Edaphocola sp.]
MINTERISNWVAHPDHLEEVAPKVLQQLSRKYPYFSVARFLLYANGGASNDNQLRILQQFLGADPVMLACWLEKMGHEPTIAANEKTAQVATEPQAEVATEVAALTEPVSVDYFQRQGINVTNELPEANDFVAGKPERELDNEDKKSLLVVMSFAEWLKHISAKSKKEREEEEDKRALRTMWQKQKLAAAMEEESDEIPEQVFEMAVNSIAQKEDTVSESLAAVYAKQGKVAKAVEIYRKLSLLNPEKSTYFAAKIEQLQKEL